MFRPLRIEFAGALYHVMARGNAREAIFRDDQDRQAFCGVLRRACERFPWRLWAYCLMDNHYRLLIETLEPTLSRGMREINGVYTQAFNRHHQGFTLVRDSGRLAVEQLSGHHGQGSRAAGTGDR